MTASTGWICCPECGSPIGQYAPFIRLAIQSRNISEVKKLELTHPECIPKIINTDTTYLDIFNELLIGTTLSDCCVVHLLTPDQVDSSRILIVKPYNYEEQEKRKISQIMPN